MANNRSNNRTAEALFLLSKRGKHDVYGKRDIYGSTFQESLKKSLQPDTTAKNTSYYEGCSREFASLKRAILESPKPDFIQNDDDFTNFKSWLNSAEVNPEASPENPILIIDRQIRDFENQKQKVTRKFIEEARKKTLP